MDSAALNKKAIACAKHYMGKTAWPTMLLTAAVVAAFVATLALTCEMLLSRRESRFLIYV